MSLTLITDPWFYIIAAPALVLIGISKAGFGSGLGIFAVPMMALIVPAFQAAAIMLPILCIMDAIGVWAYRRHWDGKNLYYMIPGAAIGIVIATAFVNKLTPEHIALLIGVIAVAFSVRYFLVDLEKPPAKRHALKGLLWAGLSGCTSFLAHAGSPPVNVYLLPQRLNKTIFVGTTAFFFASVNYMKLVPYGWLGQFSAENLGTSLVLVPIAPLAMWLGLKVHDHIGGAWFYKLCYGILIVVGVKLIGDGLALWG